jgi:aryl-alcohol dehydrogenase-like predicted oxidoreductase
MQQRQLGRSGISIAPLMVGANVFDWTIDKAMSFKVLDAFVDNGVNGIDTANAYSIWAPGHKGGESETVIGEWLKASGKRNKVVIATKAGMDLGDGVKGLSRKALTRALDDSLRRLQVDAIDLYQAHVDDMDTPQEETLSACADAIKAGKVRAIGASNFKPERLASALAISKQNNLPRYETLQPQYNLVERAGFESELQKLCLAENISVIPYYGLASGFLTGKYRKESDAGLSPRGKGVVSKYLNERGLRVLAALDAIGAETKATPAQVSLAWLMAKPTIAAPIASATSPAQVNDLLGALRVQLSATQIAALDKASA